MTMEVIAAIVVVAVVLLAVVACFGYRYKKNRGLSSDLPLANCPHPSSSRQPYVQATRAVNAPTHSEISTSMFASGGTGTGTGTGNHDGSFAAAYQLTNNPVVDSVRSNASTNHFYPELVPFRLDESEVLLTRKLSTGAFGVVWLGHFHGQPVAIKKMINNDAEITLFANEILTMAKFDHPKIVKFIGAIWTNPKDLAGITEYMDGGDVRSLLENKRVDLSWKKEKILIAIDIAEALAYLHTLKPRVIHRDLKSRNVLLTSRMIAKLSDFGLSRNRTYEETLTAGVGTVRWTAPEVMLGEDYSELADVYSFGVVLSELDTREIPFENKSARTDSGQPDMAIVIKVAKGELRPSFTSDCPPCIDRIAKACLQFDPALRPSATKLVQLLKDAKMQLRLS